MIVEPNLAAPSPKVFLVGTGILAFQTELRAVPGMLPMGRAAATPLSKFL